MSILQKIDSHLTWTFKNHVDSVLCNYRIWLEGYQVIFARSFSFAKSQQAFEIKPVSQDHSGR